MTLNESNKNANWSQRISEQLIKQLEKLIRSRITAQRDLENEITCCREHTNSASVNSEFRIV